jgi:hypothetical protein
MSIESGMGRQYRRKQGLGTSPHFRTPLSEAAATISGPLPVHQTRSIYIKHDYVVNPLSDTSDQLPGLLL